MRINLAKKALIHSILFSLLILGYPLSVHANEELGNEPLSTTDVASETVTESVYRPEAPESGNTECTVAFDPDDGRTVYPEFYKIKLEKGDKAVEPQKPERPGYFFKGWYGYLDDNGEPVFWNFAENVVEDNLTLWAAWEKGYIVAFDPDDGTSTYEDFYKLTLRRGEKVTEPPAPERAGYLFEGWYSYLDGNGEPVYWNFAEDAAEDNLTLWAAWSEAHTVLFDPNDGRNYLYEQLERVVVRAGGQISWKPADPERTGYTFSGWTINSDNESIDNRLYWDFEHHTVDHNMELYAAWNVKEEPGDAGVSSKPGNGGNITGEGEEDTGNPDQGEAIAKPEEKEDLPETDDGVVKEASTGEEMTETESEESINEAGNKEGTEGPGEERPGASTDQEGNEPDVAELDDMPLTGETSYPGVIFLTMAILSSGVLGCMCVRYKRNS